jgi:hypothetical protein
VDITRPLRRCQLASINHLRCARALCQHLCGPGWPHQRQWFVDAVASLVAAEVKEKPSLRDLRCEMFKNQWRESSEAG